MHLAETHVILSRAECMGQGKDWSGKPDCLTSVPCGGKFMGSFGSKLFLCNMNIASIIYIYCWGGGGRVYSALCLDRLRSLRACTPKVILR